MKRIYILLLLTILAVFACSHGINKGGEEENQNRIPPEAIQALHSPDDLDTLIEDIGKARIVLLGESSHGTSEFYTWRAELSKKLILEKGFNIIAVEADWADAYPVNQYIKNKSLTGAEAILQNFNRWPEWMWRNAEIADLVDWLNAQNAEKPEEQKVGFYGLDVYGIWESLEIVYNTLLEKDQEAALKAKAVMDCFKPFNFNEQAYARATLEGRNCADELQILLASVRDLIGSNPDNQEDLDLLQNTLVVVNAEKYYRAAVQNSNASWNIRDQHMSQTLNNLLEFYGPDSRIIVWEHNTHIGDARATDMADVEMVNVGQLEREKHGEENVYIVGFGTNSGEVLAAPSWGSEVQTMVVPPGKRNSWEWILHQQGPPDKIIFMEPLQKIEFYQKRIGHRAIGVVYNPLSEAGNYVPSIIPERYDAFIFIDKTNALKPLP